MSTPRMVLVYRRTQLEVLLETHSTMGAVEFFLGERGQSLALLQAADAAQRRAIEEVISVLPATYRLAQVERENLSRFLFEPDDLIVVVGQDGLVPNVAKYVDEQQVVGVSPSAPGVLCTFTPALFSQMLAGEEAAGEKELVMVEARIDDGQVLRGLNEVFIGHRSHQSARYELQWQDRKEFQSSSGLIIGTGTGATGWLASLWGQQRPEFSLPGPEEPELAFFVREAWPSASSGTSMTSGLVGGQDEIKLIARSEMVIFADGMERDCLRVDWGQSIHVRCAQKPLNLLVSV
ncbi:MAG: hypothetical protein Q4C87_08735 [Actinomycetaceae bacterium]|nr:hypothetical protein [Actinomycetaceae bacterium]